jgi:acetyl esterase/lipase
MRSIGKGRDVVWWLDLISRISRLLADLFSKFQGAEPPPAGCQVGWQPSAVAPVFYGIRDYGPDDGTPGPLRVFFPSLDGAVFDAPILEGCGRYPLILFAHGHCDEAEHFKQWYQLPASLARSGNVVVVPELPNISSHPSTADHPALDRIQAVLDWMRGGWTHRTVLLPPPSTGLVGHSYGAMLAARATMDAPVSAYASIAGVWEDWPGGTIPLAEIQVPLFICRGTDDWFTTISESLWDGLPSPKHQALLQGAMHWDYLRPGATTCERGRGPCALTASITTDLVTMFFAKHLPVQHWPDLPARIPGSLVPPSVPLSWEQQFFAGAHLTAFSQLRQLMGCSVYLRWVTDQGSGSTTRPRWWEI